MSLVSEQLRPGDGLLDLGCGSGQPIAEFFLNQGIQVTGVDVSSAMIQIAQRKFPNGTWLQSDMTSLDLNKKFAAIIAWDSFFHLGHAEQEQMFPIFRSHLSPKGILVLTSGPERGEAIGDLNGEPLYHSSLSPSEYRELFRANSLEEVSFHPNDPECGGHTVWICRALGD